MLALLMGTSLLFASSVQTIKVIYCHRAVHLVLNMRLSIHFFLLHSQILLNLKSKTSWKRFLVHTGGFL